MSNPALSKMLLQKHHRAKEQRLISASDMILENILFMN